MPEDKGLTYDELVKMGGKPGGYSYEELLAAGGKPGAAPAAAPPEPKAPFLKQTWTQRNADYVYSNRGYMLNPMNPNARKTGPVKVFTSDGKIIDVDLGASKLPPETAVAQAAAKVVKPYDIADHPEDVAEMPPGMRVLMNAGITGRKLAGSALKLGKGFLDFAGGDVGPAGIEDIQAAGQAVHGVANLPAATRDVANKIQQGAQAGDVKQMGEGVDKFVTDVAPNMLLAEGAVRGATGTTGMTNVEAARSILNDVTTPEARLMAAGNQRASLASTPTVGSSAGSALKSGLNTNTLDLVNHLGTGAVRIGRKIAAPTNEFLAEFMTKNDTSPFANYQGRLDNSAFKDAPGPQPADNYVAGTFRTAADAQRYDRGVAGAGFGVGDEAIRSQADFGKSDGLELPERLAKMREDSRAAAAEKLKQTLKEHALDTEMTPPPPPAPAIDAPAVNRWLGAKVKDMRFGADAGDQIMRENLLGPDKQTTLENIKPALKDAETQIGAALEKADKTGKTVDAKGILDAVIADAEKPYAKGTDEAFEKLKEQFSTDAFEKFSDYHDMKPSRVHELRKWVRKTVNWDTAANSPFNKMLKDFQAKLNAAIDGIDPDVRPANRRWGNLDLGKRYVENGIVADKAGRGTGPTPKLRVPGNVPARVRQPYERPEPPSMHPEGLP